MTLITTVADVKAFAGIVDTESDVVLGILVEAVDAHIRGICTIPTDADGAEVIKGDLKMAAISLTMREFNRRNQEGATSVSAGGASVVFADSIDGQVQSVLNKYRTYHV